MKTPLPHVNPLSPFFSETQLKNAMQAAYDEGAVDAAKVCGWSLYDDESGTWESGCGELWSFIDGGPCENRIRYCHYCGGKVLLNGVPCLDLEATPTAPLQNPQIYDQTKIDKTG